MAEQGHFLEGKKIIVAGSGVAGLAFVVALRKQWNPALEAPQITIYDRDDKQGNIEREGYSLSLNGLDENGGLVASRDLGLLDKMMDHAVVGLDGNACFRMWSSDWTELLSVKPKPYKDMPRSSIRIPRRDLRNVLIEAGEGANGITWSAACISAERLKNGRIAVQVAPVGPDGIDASNSRTEECDLLIAADGASSKIRASLRPQDTLNYAGCVQLGGVARFPNGIPEPISQNWGMVTTGKGAACFFSPVDTTGVVWALSRFEPQARGKYNRGSNDEFEALKRDALEIGQMIGEPFGKCVAATEQNTSFILPARDKTPFKHDESLRGVIFIGDSNHAVSPFAGNGANLAMKDGWDLAEQLCKGKSLDEAVAAYDELAVPRAVATIKTSHGRMNMGHYTGIKARLFRTSMRFASWFI